MAAGFPAAFVLFMDFFDAVTYGLARIAGYILLP